MSKLSYQYNPDKNQHDGRVFHQLSYQYNPDKNQHDGRVFHQLLDSKAENNPDTEAIIMYDMDLNRSAMTFAEYRDRSIHLATSILDLGLSRGHRVLLIGQTSLPYMVFSMAFNRIGCNSILLGAGSLTRDKVDLLKTLNCKMIVYDLTMKESQKKQLFEGIEQLTQHNADNNNEKTVLVSMSPLAEEFSKNQCHSYDSLLVHGQSQSLSKLQEAQNQVQFDDPIVATFTSGSTGIPKVVQNTIHSIRNFYAAYEDSIQIQSPVTYIDRPFSWIIGYIICQFGAFSNSIPVWVPTEIALSETANDAVFKIWEEEKCTTCALSVSLIHKMYTEKVHLKYNLSHVKVFVLGSQRFGFEHFAKIFTMFPDVQVMNTYGCTESLKIAGKVMGKECLVEGKFAKLSISSGAEVKLVDVDDKVVPRGTAGEICARSCRVFLEYLGNPEATKQSKSPTGWFRTGDIGVMYDDGNIEVLGRKTEIIKRATVKIFPAEIENVLLQHPNVAEAVVVGIPDQQVHEEICACVVLKDTEDGSRDEKTKLQELQDWCRERWPPGPDGLHLTPKYFLALKTFPFTKTGKVFTRELKAEAIKRVGMLN